MALPDPTMIDGGLFDLSTEEHPDEAQMLRAKRGSKSSTGPDVAPEDLEADKAVVWSTALQTEVVERVSNALQWVPDGAKHRRLLRRGHLLGGVARKLTDYTLDDLAEALVEKLEQSPSEIADRDAAVATALRGLKRGMSKPVLAAPFLQSLNLGPAFEGFTPNIEAPSPPFEKHLLIDAAGKLPELADQLEAALIASGLPVFQRGNRLVRPVAVEVAAADGRKTISASFQELEQGALTDLSAQAAIFVQMRKPSGRPKKLAEGEQAAPATLVPVVVDPRPAIVGTVLCRPGQWRFPRVAGVITTPSLRPDGTVLCTPGFDPVTRLFLMPDPALDLSRMPAHPTAADARRGLERLGALLPGFKFVDSVARSVALAGILTAVCRGALGAVPLTAWSAPAPGSSKSYYTDLVSTIASGRPCPVFSAGEDVTEMEKRLTAALLAGFPVIAIDNVSAGLGGDLLCAAVTQESFRLRPLGRSEMVEVEGRGFTIFANGNNLQVVGDMTRRVLLGRFDTGMERPEQRQFPFDPIARVLADRSSYVAAALSVVRGYVLAGCPGRLPTVGSFGRWSDLIRSALVWLGAADPLAAMQTARETDTVTGTLGAVLTAWNGFYGAEAVTCRKVVSDLGGFTVDINRDALRDAIAPVATNGKGLDALKLGNWLRGSRGRPIGRLKFASDAMGHGGVAAWRVVTT